MTTPITPNPYSPYADADPNTRHLIPTLFGPPAAGNLILTACGGMAVVPPEPLGDASDALAAGRLDDLPPGLCPVCVSVATGQAPEPDGIPGTCRDCGMDSSHGDLCALCRMDQHDAWRANRTEATR